MVNYDIKRVDNVRRNTERAHLLLRSYARNISQQVPITTIRKDMIANDTGTLDENTIMDYVKALKSYMSSKISKHGIPTSGAKLQSARVTPDIL